MPRLREVGAQDRIVWRHSAEGRLAAPPARQLRAEQAQLDLPGAARVLGMVLEDGALEVLHGVLAPVERGPLRELLRDRVTEARQPAVAFPVVEEDPTEAVPGLRHEGGVLRRRPRRHGQRPQQRAEGDQQGGNQSSRCVRSSHHSPFCPPCDLPSRRLLARPRPLGDGPPIDLPPTAGDERLRSADEFVQTFYVERTGPNLVFGAYAPTPTNVFPFRNSRVLKK